MKIGIIGNGSIGSRHAANAASLGHEVIVFDPANRTDVRSEQDVYESCEAVVIATPSAFHFGGLRSAVDAGCHVLIEKPIALSEFKISEILDIAEMKALVVMMGNNLRFHPAVQQAKRWIANGDIGRPLWASFICASKSIKAPYLSDGVILNTGSHEVDLAMHLLGPAEVVSANARCSEYGDEIADFVIEHESGCRSSFHIDFVTPNEIRESWIVGEERNVGIDLPGRRISLGQFVTGVPGNYDDDYVNELRAFVGRINGEITPGATGEDGLATLKVLLAVKRKAGIG